MMRENKWLKVVIIVLLFGGKATLDETARAETKASIELKLCGVKKIWDYAPHNAFTDMIRFDDCWYVAFREAENHGIPPVGKPGGKIRIIRSDDGENWTSVGLLEYGPNQDVRDAKLNITPNGRIMLLAAAAPHAQSNERQSLVWFSQDGLQWSGPQKVGEKDWWLWRVAWSPDGTVYGVAYGDITRRPRTTRLYKSRDGINFDTIVKTLTSEPETGEAGLIFRRDGSAVALVRQDGEQKNAKVGTARGDFTKWKFHNLGVRVGGPTLIELPSGHVVAATRLYDGKVRTALSLLDPEGGKLVELLSLPSGGDSSYPGLVWYDNLLWVSYYSSHEGKTSIYFAKVQVCPLEKNKDKN